MRVVLLFFRMCMLSFLILDIRVSVAEDFSSYQSVTGPCYLRFPQDHGPHPGYRTEWWYYTGNVRSLSGEPFGFQLTFFRRQISPPGSERSWPEQPSAWRTQQLILAHAAVSDIARKRFYHSEEAAREALGLAAAIEESGITTIFLKDWSVRLNQAEHKLAARANDFSFELTLKPSKEPVPHGDSGYSLKGKTADRASCYYSFTRLEAEGSLAIEGNKIPVSGEAWMDHEFSSAPLEPDLVGWDWFSLQLDNNTELMIYLLRQKDGTHSAASRGTLVEASGKVRHLADETLEVRIMDHWKSPHSGASYPSRWGIRVPSLQIDLTVLPNLDDQEMETPASTRITYWEGSVSANGTVQGRPVTGAGYVELTGYAKPMDVRF